jgi:preprotein translocase subunit SecG
MPIAFAYTLIVLLIITSGLLTLLILLHRGKGGGLSSMFGGGVSSNLAGSSVAEKNLDRYTILVGIVWRNCFRHRFTSVAPSTSGGEPPSDDRSEQPWQVAAPSAARGSAPAPHVRSSDATRPPAAR